MDDVRIVQPCIKVFEIELPIESGIEFAVSVTNSLLLDHDLLGTVTGRDVGWRLCPYG